MIKILNVLGKQDEPSDMSFIQDEGVQKYQKRIQNNFKLNDIKLKEVFPNTRQQILVLLREMLEFNPFFRPTAKECLSNPIFKNIRVPGLEASAPFKINIDVDRNDHKFDYEETNVKFADLNHDKIISTFRGFVFEEVIKLKQQIN